MRRTKAEKDQDHMEMVITNNPNIPDRTAYILGESTDDPVPVILSDAERLRVAGAELLVMPCNTAHSFYKRIQDGTELPVVDMISETVTRAKRNGANRVGILATTGTIKTGIYQSACEDQGMIPVVPNAHIQSIIMSLIYEDIKAGRPADWKKWEIIHETMKEIGCDEIILGCTELSIVREELKLEGCIDSLLVLAETAIEQCGYKLK